MKASWPVPEVAQGIAENLNSPEVADRARDSGDETIRNHLLSAASAKNTQDALKPLGMPETLTAATARIVDNYEKLSKPNPREHYADINAMEAELKFAMEAGRDLARARAIFEQGMRENDYMITKAMHEGSQDPKVMQEAMKKLGNNNTLAFETAGANVAYGTLRQIEQMAQQSATQLAYMIGQEHLKTPGVTEKQAGEMVLTSLKQMRAELDLKLAGGQSYFENDDLYKQAIKSMQDTGAIDQLKDDIVTQLGKKPSFLGVSGKDIVTLVGTVWAGAIALGNLPHFLSNLKGYVMEGKPIDHNPIFYAALAGTAAGGYMLREGPDKVLGTSVENTVKIAERRDLQRILSSPLEINVLTALPFDNPEFVDKQLPKLLAQVSRNPETFTGDRLQEALVASGVPNVLTANQVKALTSDYGSARIELYKAILNTGGSEDRRLAALTLRDLAGAKHI